MKVHKTIPYMTTFQRTRSRKKTKSCTAVAEKAVHHFRSRRQTMTDFDSRSQCRPKVLSPENIRRLYILCYHLVIINRPIT